MRRFGWAAAGGAVLAFAVSTLALGGGNAPPSARAPDQCTLSGGEPTLEAMVLHASPALAIPTRLELVGDYLVVLDPAADSVLHVVNRHSGDLVRSLGGRGRGPGEFYGAWALDATRDGEAAVWVYDVMLRRLTLVGLEPAAAMPIRSSPMVALSDGRLVVEPRWLDGGRIVAAGLLSDALLALYDTAGQPIGSVGRPLVPLTPSQPPQAVQARLVLHPDGATAVLAHRYLSTLAVVSLATSSVTSIAGPVDVNAGGEPVSLDRFAYVDVAVTAEEIVTLFSGRASRVHGSSAPFGRCLHVFDWQGDFTGGFRLSDDVIAIAADPEGRFVYALRHDPAPAVIRFRLPPRGPSRPVASRDGGA